MQKGKRILALIGAILLVALFATTLILAMLGSTYTFDVLMVSIVACALIPTMIFVYQWIFKVMKRNKDENDQSSGKFPASVHSSGSSGSSDSTEATEQDDK